MFAAEWRAYGHCDYCDCLRVVVAAAVIEVAVVDADDVAGGELGYCLHWPAAAWLKEPSAALGMVDQKT